MNSKFEFIEALPPEGGAPNALSSFLGRFVVLYFSLKDHLSVRKQNAFNIRQSVTPPDQSTIIRLFSRAL
jgi:hypothetical protein